MLLSPKSPHIMPKGGWIYTQPETGVKFVQTSISALESLVVKHRRAMGLDLGPSWGERWLDDVCRQNPNAPSQPNPYANGYEPPHVVEGRKLWNELHQHARQHESSQDSRIEEWFRSWVARVPNYSGCRCRDNFRAILAAFPPDFSSGKFHAWTVLVHNEVNKKLGKPLYTSLNVVS